MAISALPRIIASNVFASMTSSFEASAQVAVAERGLLFRIDISPTNSPAPSEARIFSTSPTCFEIVIRPCWTTYISLPGSPSRKRTVPCGNSFPKRWKSWSSAMGAAHSSAAKRC